MKITSEFLDSIAVIIRKTKLPYDKTFSSTIWKKENGKYGISLENRLYFVPNALGNELSVGTGVWVKIPNGKLREMHICGVKN